MTAFTPRYEILCVFLSKSLSPRSAQSTQRQLICSLTKGRCALCELCGEELLDSAPKIGSKSDASYSRVLIHSGGFGVGTGGRPAVISQ
jgi:hypothetical protein